MKSDTWYFAYGSNLWIDQAVHRTGAIRTADERPRIARLKNFRLVFNKRGRGVNVYANIMPCDGEEVIGVVYHWDTKARQTMGEEYERGYEEQTVEATTDLDEKLKAVTFVASPRSICDEAVPSTEYLEKIILGAGQHGLSEEYLERIERIAGDHED